MSSADLVREVKYRAKIDRDVELAEMVNVGRANVSSWLKRGTKPDAIALLDLMILGNLDAKETKRILQGGYASPALLFVTGIASTAGLAWFKISGMLYIMLNDIMSKIKAKLWAVGLKRSIHANGVNFS